MQANYFTFKKQFKKDNFDKGWTKEEFWSNLKQAWEKIAQIPLEIRPPTKVAKPFPFQQFTVQQSDDVFKVGTDGVLLGAWTRSEGAKNILEIGAGTGYISLMMAQRNQKAQYEALEIMEAAYHIATENFKTNPWGTSMSVYHTPFQEFQNKQKYDVIACAPPYFENSTLSGHKEIDVARHKITLTYEEVVQFSKEKLNESGILSMIIPYSQKGDLEAIVKKEGMFIQRQMIIQGTPMAPPKRFMVQIGKTCVENESELMVIEIKGRHFHSPEFIELTKDYYNYFIPESLQYKLNQ